MYTNIPVYPGTEIYQYIQLHNYSSISKNTTTYTSIYRYTTIPVYPGTQLYKYIQEHNYTSISR